jgi:hypothetical protein
MERLTPTLTDVLVADRWWFAQFGESLITDLPTRHLIYQDNGADILAVGHIDTVDNHRSIQTEAGIEAHNKTMQLAKFHQTGPQLDDRLGVWALLSVLPDFMNYDILLTDNEEIGQSTASSFELPNGKAYHWIFELDRRGDGCVLYQYGSKKWNKELIRAGFRIDRGSFSDIGYLDHLGVQAVNVGVGYDHEHTLACDWDINIMREQLKKLVNFYERNKDKRYAYNRSRVSPIGGRAWLGRINGTLHKPITQSARVSYHDYLDYDMDFTPWWDTDSYLEPTVRSKEELVKLVNGREYTYNGFSWSEAENSRTIGKE